MKTKEDLHKLVVEICKNNIPTSDFGIDANDNFIFTFLGFSKSGTADVYLNQEDGVIVCETRYNTYDIIETFDDFVMVAYSWWNMYKDRSPFEQPDIIFVPHFIRLGLIKEVTETKYISC